MFKTLTASALILATATAATAGGFTQAAVEPEVFVAPAEEEAGSLGRAAPYIIGALVIVGIAALVASNDDDDDDDDSDSDEPAADEPVDEPTDVTLLD